MSALSDFCPAVYPVRLQTLTYFGVDQRHAAKLQSDMMLCPGTETASQQDQIPAAHPDRTNVLDGEVLFSNLHSLLAHEYGNASASSNPK